MTDRWLSRLRSSGWLVLALILIGGAAMLARSLFTGSTAPERHAVTTVTRVLLPPPPPPPPPKEKPPPEPEKKPLEQPKLAEPRAEPKAEPKKVAAPKPAAPPGSPLTAEAGAGNNPYGLGVGNGGGDTIGGGGGGGGGGGANYGFYAGLLQTQIQAALKRDEKTRYGRFRVGLKISLSPTGQITQASVVSSSGDASVDSAITRVIGGLSVGQAVPAGMPQTLNVRISAIPG